MAVTAGEAGTLPRWCQGTVGAWPELTTGSKADSEARAGDPDPAPRPAAASTTVPVWPPRRDSNFRVRVTHWQAQCQPPLCHGPARDWQPQAWTAIGLGGVTGTAAVAAAVHWHWQARVSRSQ